MEPKLLLFKYSSLQIGYYSFILQQCVKLYQFIVYAQYFRKIPNLASVEHQNILKFYLKSSDSGVFLANRQTNLGAKNNFSCHFNMLIK